MVPRVRSLALSVMAIVAYLITCTELDSGSGLPKSLVAKAVQQDPAM
jgi:hypothetical protein